MDRSRYPTDWPEISRRIRERDGNACAMCGVANGALIQRPDGGVTRVILTVAHLYDPNPMNCADDNLAALCQKHHLALDLDHHLENRRKTMLARKLRVQAVLPSLEGLIIPGGEAAGSPA